MDEQKTITAQEFFNRVAAHLLKQNKRAMIENRESQLGYQCLYRAPDGCKCAYGCMIPDDAYEPQMEGVRPRRLHEVYPVLAEMYGHLDIEFIHNLQYIHDRWEPNEWRGQLANIARQKGLVFDQFASPEEILHAGL